MPFKKFVEIGRVAVLNGEGPNKGKIAAIVNVIDQNRVLVDGPTSGVLRQVKNTKVCQLCICLESNKQVNRILAGLPHQAAAAHPHLCEVPLQRLHQGCQG